MDSMTPHGQAVDVQKGNRQASFRCGLGEAASVAGWRRASAGGWLELRGLARTRFYFGGNDNDSHSDLQIRFSPAAMIGRNGRNAVSPSDGRSARSIAQRTHMRPIRGRKPMTAAPMRTILIDTRIVATYSANHSHSQAELAMPHLIANIGIVALLLWAAMAIGL